jgi:hypothetical protein
VRPRFSLKWLLIACSLVAVALYVFFVHPTVRANRFVDAINGGDFRELTTLGMLKDLKSFSQDFSFENCTVSAELKPRTWRDVYKFRRKALVRIDFPKGQTADRASALRNYVMVHIDRVSWGDEP